MNKVNIVLHPNEFTSFKSAYLEPIFEKYFNIIEYDEQKTYDTRTIFVTNVISDKSWGLQMQNRGYKVAGDNLWEEVMPSPFYTIHSPNWFWYNEALWYNHLGYDKYVPNRQYSKLAFMPINLKKPFRDTLMLALSPMLDSFIYSYANQLPGDINRIDAEWQRYFNPKWYDQTYFSLVVETTIFGTGFITEKTFKPIAFKHPFMVYGQPDTLGGLHRLGFETYENLFDESYDSLISIDDKVSHIVDNIINFTQQPYTKLTLDKIDFNHNLFYNVELIKNNMEQEIITPLIEYAETA